MAHQRFRSTHRMVVAISLILSLGSAIAQTLRQLRFSPDGHYVLAQDRSLIIVLTVHPLAVLFQIPAEKADVAQFTPDSRQVVFIASHTNLQAGLPFSESGTRVERWSVTQHARTTLKAILSADCATESLSPDGRVWACVDFAGTLRLRDVASGEAILEKRRFNKLQDYCLPDQFPCTLSGDLGYAQISFSPDSRFFLALPLYGSAATAWDLESGALVKLTGALARLRKDPSRCFFAFVAPDQLILSSPDWARHDFVTAKLVAFPGGQVLSTPRIPWGKRLSAATNPDFLIVGNLIRYQGRLQESVNRGVPIDPADVLKYGTRTVAVELSTGQATISNSPALDVFGRLYVAERASGEVGLYEISGGVHSAVVVPLATVSIPRK
jgi:hypothetical protein